MNIRVDNVVIAPVQHGQPASARSVRRTINAERPSLVMLEAGPRRAASGSLGRTSHSFDPTKFAILGPLDAWLWNAFGQRLLLNARLLAGNESCDEMAAAATAAAMSGSGPPVPVICGDRDELVTLVRASAQGGWQVRRRRWILDPYDSV